MKFRTIIVGLFVIIGSISVSEAVTVSVSNMAANPGSTGVVVPIVIDDATGVAGGTITLEFNASVLTPTKIEGSTLLSSVNVTPNANLNFSPGQIKINWAGFNAIASGSGDLVNVTFDTKSDATPGVYEVKLQVSLSDINGSAMQVTAQNGNFTISGTLAMPSQASFLAVPTSGPIPLTVQFTDNSTNAVSWEWDFGDGSDKVSQQNPSHTYTQAGSHTVTLKVTNSAGDNSTTQTIITTHVSRTTTVSISNVTARPGSTGVVLPIMIDDATGVSGGTITLDFNANILTPTKVEGSALLSSVNVTPNVNLNFGPGQIRINWAGFNAIASGSGDLVNVTFDTKSDAAPGVYEVRSQVSLTDINGSAMQVIAQNGNFTISKPVEPPTRAAFSVSPTSGSVPLAVQFTDNSTGEPTSWSWNFGDGGTSTEQNPSHTYTQAGSYTVTLKVTNSSGSNSTTQTITVSETLGSDPTISIGETKSGSLSTVGETVYYKLDLAESNLYSIIVNSSDFDGRVQVYNANSVDEISDANLTHNQDNAVFTEVLIVPLSSGIYIIGISEFEHKEIGMFSISVDSVVTEQIAVGETKNDDLNKRGDTRYYRLTLSESTEVNFTLESSFDGRLLIYRADSVNDISDVNLIANVDESSSLETFSQTLSANIYIIAVIEFQDNATGTFSLSVMAPTSPSKVVDGVPDTGDGIWVLDLNTQSGDQEKRELNTLAGQEFNIQVLFTQAISESRGFFLGFEFDAEKIIPVPGILHDFPIVLDEGTVNGNRVQFTVGSLSPIAVEPGAVAQVSFKTVDGFSGETEIWLCEAGISSGEDQLKITSIPSIVIREGTSDLRGDFNNDGAINFPDFLGFAGAFGTPNATFDLDGDGAVGFSDFLIFARNFGKKSEKPILTKVVTKTAQFTKAEAGSGTLGKARQGKKMQLKPPKQ